VAGAEDHSSAGSHTTRVLGGWSCRGCSLKICAICASHELSRGARWDCADMT
jgi:hypothetical protein